MVKHVIAVIALLAPFTSSFLNKHASCKLNNPARPFLNKLSSVSFTSEVCSTIKDELYQELLQEINKVGQVGSKTTEENRKLIEIISNKIIPYSENNPARLELIGEHNLLYSASPGGSSGAIGPFTGKVSQRFINDTSFQNIVNLGPLEITLTAERKILDDNRVRVKFIETSVKLLSVEVLKKETKGQGVWNNLFSGVVRDADGNPMLLRIMKTPSLFIIKQRL